MEQVRRVFPDFRKHRVLTGTVILLAIQAISITIFRQSGASESGVRAASLLGALGMFAIGALNVAHTPYPRWAYRSMVAILAAGVLITPMTVRNAGSWVEQTSVLWLFPWFLVTQSTLGAPKTGICAPGHPRAGLLLVGMALVMVGITLLLGRL